MNDLWSLSWMVVDFLEILFYWAVLPIIVIALTSTSFICAVVWLGNAVVWAFRGRREAWFALGGSAAASVFGIVLGWLLYQYYLIPIAYEAIR